MAEPPKVGDTWYRFNDCQVSQGYTDYTGDYVSTGSKTVIILEKFTVIKLTPCGVRLQGNYLVCNHWTKKFACPTIELAKESFIARKKRQYAIYNARAVSAKECINLVEKGMYVI